MRARAKKKGNQARIKEFPDSVSVREAIRKGNATVRLSCLVMGAGNLRYGQYVKGILFLAAEVVYILFMSLFGAGALAGLTTLGIQTTQEVFNETKQIYEYVQGDNSMLFLLYGVAVIFITIGFFIIWRTNVKSAYAQQKRKEQGKPVLRLREDLKSLLPDPVRGHVYDPAAGVHDLHGIYQLRQEPSAARTALRLGGAGEL